MASKCTCITFTTKTKPKICTNIKMKLTTSPDGHISTTMTKDFEIRKIIFIYQFNILKKTIFFLIIIHIGQNETTKQLNRHCQPAPVYHWATKPKRYFQNSNTILPWFANFFFNIYFTIRVHFLSLILAFIYIFGLFVLKSLRHHHNSRFIHTVESIT